MPQDFSGQNLRGRSFKGQNFIGANFGFADIRGVDFSKAILRGANFSNAKTELKKHSVIILLIASLLLLLLSGFFIGYSWSYALDSLFYYDFDTQHFFISQDFEDIANILITLVTLATFCIVIIRYETGMALVPVAIAGVVALAMGDAEIAMAVLAAVAGSVVATIAGVVAGVVASRFFVTQAIAIAISVFGSVAFFTENIEPSVRSMRVEPSELEAKLKAAAAITDHLEVELEFMAKLSAVAVILTLAMAGVYTYITWRALAGDEKYTSIQKIAIAFAATGGTSFRGADLTNADFTSATLKSTDFRGAILTHTCWTQAKKLDRMRPGKTYLKNVQLRQWLIGNGQNKNFDRQDLRGVNLKGANLADASFIGADLSEANLQEADLSRAKLVQTQLDRTDFTGATLTGAYLEDWGITSDTKFHRVKCEYVYMRLPTKENPEPLRKPDNRQEVFNDGDFADFIQPIFDTLDLYHNQGVDPRAIAIAFKQLADTKLRSKEVFSDEGKR